MKLLVALAVGEVVRHAERQGHFEPDGSWHMAVVDADADAKRVLAAWPALPEAMDGGAASPPSGSEAWPEAWPEARPEAVLLEAGGARQSPHRRQNRRIYQKAGLETGDTLVVLSAFESMPPHAVLLPRGTVGKITHIGAGAERIEIRVDWEGFGVLTVGGHQMDNIRTVMATGCPHVLTTGTGEILPRTDHAGLGDAGSQKEILTGEIKVGGKKKKVSIVCTAYKKLSEECFLVYAEPKPASPCKAEFAVRDLSVEYEGATSRSARSFELRGAGITRSLKLKAADGEQALAWAEKLGELRRDQARREALAAELRAAATPAAFRAFLFAQDETTRAKIQNDDAFVEKRYQLLIEVAEEAAETGPYGGAPKIGRAVKDVGMPLRDFRENCARLFAVVEKQRRVEQWQQMAYDSCTTVIDTLDHLRDQVSGDPTRFEMLEASTAEEFMAVKRREGWSLADVEDDAPLWDQLQRLRRTSIQGAATLADLQQLLNVLTEQDGTTLRQWRKHCEQPHKRQEHDLCTGVMLRAKLLTRARLLAAEDVAAFDRALHEGGTPKELWAHDREVIAKMSRLLARKPQAEAEWLAGLAAAHASRGGRPVRRQQPTGQEFDY